MYKTDFFERGFSAMNFSKLDQFMDTMPTCGIPACDLAVSYQGKIVYRRGVGFSDAAKTKPVSPDDLYYIFSVSKITTCVAAMRLVEQGLIGLDNPVSKYLPTFARLTVKNGKGVSPAQNAMTVRHLFTMTGGMNYALTSPAIVRALQDPNASTIDLVNAMADTPLEFEPGVNYLYSLCHDVLAAVVEVASGVRFSEYVQKNIFDPLGMTRTGYHLPKALKEKMSAMYQFVPRVQKSVEIPIANQYILNDNYDSGGAGLYSCVDDQLRLLTVLACGGKTEEGYVLLRPETIAAMGVNLLPESAMPQFTPTRLYGYGWGLCGRAHVDPTVSRALSSVGEFGWDGAAGAFGLVDPTKQVAIYFGTHIKGCQYAYHLVHPTVRDMVFEAIGNEE